MAIMLLELIHDLIDGLSIVIFHAAAHSISKHFLGQTAIEIEPMPGGQSALHFANVVKFLAGDKLACGVDWLVAFLLAPHAERIEVFQRQAERVHAIVAGSAKRFIAVSGEDFAEGWLAAIGRL